MKNLLKELNMTIQQFSEKYEIPYNTVRQWERGLNSPPKYVINLLREKIEREKNGEQISVYNKEIYVIENNGEIQYVYTSEQEARKWESFCRNVSKYKETKVYIGYIEKEI